MVADDRLDGGEDLRRAHEGDGDAGAFEDRLDDLAVVEVGDDDAVLHGVAADDTARITSYNVCYTKLLRARNAG